MKGIVLSEKKRTQLQDEISRQMLASHPAGKEWRGEDIRNVSPYPQVNHFILFQVFQEWSKHVARLDHPWFDFDSTDVAEAKRRFLAVLSQQIRIPDADFRRLLSKAVYNTLKLITTPEESLGNFFFGNSESIPLPLYERYAAYFQDYNFIVQSILRYHQKHEMAEVRREVFMEKMRRVIEIYESKDGQSLAGYKRQLFKQLTGRELDEVLRQDQSAQSVQQRPVTPEPKQETPPPPPPPVVQREPEPEPEPEPKAEVVETPPPPPPAIEPVIEPEPQPEAQPEVQLEDSHEVVPELPEEEEKEAESEGLNFAFTAEEEEPEKEHHGDPERESPPTFEPPKAEEERPTPQEEPEKEHHGVPQTPPASEPEEEKKPTLGDKFSQEERPLSLHERIAREKEKRQAVYEKSLEQRKALEELQNKSRQEPPKEEPKREEAPVPPPKEEERPALDFSFSSEEKQNSPQEEPPQSEPETELSDASNDNRPAFELFQDKKEEEHQTIASKFGDDQGGSILSRHNAKKELSLDKIPVNKQFQIVQKIFGGSSVKFKVVLDKINKAQTKREAEDILDKYVFNSPEANRHDKVAQEFEDMVRGHFN